MLDINVKQLLIHNIKVLNLMWTHK